MIIINDYTLPSLNSHKGNKKKTTVYLLLLNQQVYRGYFCCH